MIRRWMLAVLVLAALTVAVDVFDPTSRPFAVAATVEPSPPVLPRIDAAMKQQLRTIYLKGLRSNNRPGVFAKIGDSISESELFLVDVGCGVAKVAGRTAMATAIKFFRKIEVPVGRDDAWCGRSNSFTRIGVSAVSGWDSGDPLQRFDEPVEGCPEPYDTPLRCELHILKPSTAIVMYGTNDTVRLTVGEFTENLTAIVAQCIADGVIPILSTIPPQPDDPARESRTVAFNTAIIAVAAAQGVPLLNYWRAMMRLADEGISEDGTHPNVFGGCARKCFPADFGAEGLGYGYNQRNFTALQTLMKVKRIVFNDGAPDPDP